MLNDENFILETLQQILLQLKTQEDLLSSQTSPRIYDNKALMELLDIKDRYLKRLRDNGLLGYSRYGDKYWYTQADVESFLSQCHYAPFGSNKS